MLDLLNERLQTVLELILVQVGSAAHAVYTIASPSQDSPLSHSPLRSVVAACGQRT
jgi:hypothetical protein